MLRRSFQIAVTAFVAGALLAGVGTGASATGRSAVSRPAPAVSDVVYPEVQNIAAALAAGQQVAVGQSGGAVLTLWLDREALVVTTNSVSGGITQTGPRSADACWKAYVIASAIFAVGAAALATIIAAAIASGAAVITIAGFTASVETWIAIAAAMGSWSALLAYITSITC